MATPTRTTGEKNREEDYRDYEARDLGDGWPYADQDPVQKQNAPYGSNPDQLDPSNMEIADDPVIDSDGGPSFDPDLEAGTIDDDGIEEQIADKLSDSGRFDDNQLEITVRNGVATLEGEVETEHDRQFVNQIALRTPGVKSTINNLILIGVDSLIPSDVDD